MKVHWLNIAVLVLVVAGVSIAVPKLLENEIPESSPQG
jgi:hypothetical protein